MALYTVTARFKFNKAAEFQRRLTDGTIESQQPDGREIVASMQRALVGRDGLVRWTETCYCDPPLLHERQTVYNHFFADMRIRDIDDHEDVAGEPFMKHLAQASG